MATRGFENFTATDAARHALKHAPQPKPSKYRNVKVNIDGEVFDSKREAAYWQQLKLREKACDIQGLERQVRFPLYTPSMDEDWRVRQHAGVTVVAEYVADFVFYTGFEKHVVDAKGKRTQMYALKKKWLELQSGIVIEEV